MPRSELGGLVDAFLGKSVEQIMAIQLLGAVNVVENARLLKDMYTPLLSASLGAQSLLFAARCLRAGLPEVLKANLMGSLHWCLLLVLGQSILAAGLKERMLEFNLHGAAAQMSCQACFSRK